MFGQERFKSEFIVYSDPLSYFHGRKHEKARVLIQASDTIGFVYTEVYYCKGEYIGPVANGAKKGDYKYALATTYFHDHVVLCKTIRTPPGHNVAVHWNLHALEIVKNLDEKYLIEAP